MTDTAEIDQKEHHRLGTMGKWDPPEDDWAAEYDWTRYRGPDPWPVPGGWVFGDPEMGGWWTYFGDAGVGHHKKNGILDELKADDSVEAPYDAWDDLSRDHGQHASLTAETANPDEVSMRNPGNEQLEWTLEVDGTQVFRRVEPDRPDLMTAVVEALQAYHDGELEERCDEIVPTSGRKPADVREREEQERREEENESLDEFATDGGRDEYDLDHYDLILRSMEEGLIIGVNNAPAVSACPLDEVTVVYSKDQETEVMARRGHEDHVWITRDDDGDLVLREEDDHGSRYVDDVVSIEIVGMESAPDPDDLEPRPIYPSIPQRTRFEAIKAEWSEDGTPELTDRQVFDGLLDTKQAAEDGYYSDQDSHEFEQGDRFAGLPEYRWEVTNRMVDVDTDDTLYHLLGVGDPNRNDTKVITESSLRENFEQVAGAGESDE